MSAQMTVSFSGKSTRMLKSAPNAIERDSNEIAGVKLATYQREPSSIYPMSQNNQKLWNSKHC